LAGNLRGDGYDQHCVASQKLSGQNKGLAYELRNILSDFMSRHVAKISVCFQGFPIFAGGSTRHGRNMDCFIIAMQRA